MNASPANPKTFAVWFKDLDRWDPASFERIVWKWPKAIMRPIASFLRPRREKVDRSKHQFADLQPITIHFDGTIDRRTVDGNREYTMNLFFARIGDVVVAKIDLKNGAVAIVPDWKNVAVTGHFAVYEPDRKAVIPEYFHLVIQASFFKTHLWRNKVGAEGRKEVKLDFFEAQEIPLPPLPVQRAIVRRWQEAQEEIGKAQARTAALEADITREVLKRLGVQPAEVYRLPKVFAVQWKDLTRWGVEFNRYPMRAEKLLVSSKYATVPLEQVAWINPTAAGICVGPDDPVSFVPMEAVSEESGEIVRHLEKPCREVAKGYTRFANGDVIWAKITPCMQNGKCAIGRNLVNGVGFGSTEFHVVRTKDVRELLPEFVWALLRLDAVRRCAQRYFIGSAGQQRVPPSFLCDLRIPLPSSAVQCRIVDMVTQKRREAAREREAAAKLSAEVTQEVEELIMGTRPAKGAKA